MNEVGWMLKEHPTLQAEFFSSFVVGFFISHQVLLFYHFPHEQ